MFVLLLKFALSPLSEGTDSERRTEIRTFFSAHESQGIPEVIYIQRADDADADEVIDIDRSERMSGSELHSHEAVLCTLSQRDVTVNGRLYLCCWPSSRLCHGLEGADAEPKIYTCLGSCRSWPLVIREQ